MNSKKHTLSRKVLATLLTAAMLITMLPSAMFANGDGGSGQSTAKSDSYVTIDKTATAGSKPGTWDVTLTVTPKEQEISQLSQEVVLVLDTSSSMNEKISNSNKTRWQVLQSVLTEKDGLIDTFAKAGTKLAVVLFASHNQVDNLTQGFVDLSDAQNVSRVKNEINTKNFGENRGTDIYAGLSEALEMLEGSTASNPSVILLSDGACDIDFDAYGYTSIPFGSTHSGEIDPDTAKGQYAHAGFWDNYDYSYYMNLLDQSAQNIKAKASLYSISFANSTDSNGYKTLARITEAGMLYSSSSYQGLKANFEEIASKILPMVDDPMGAEVEVVDGTIQTTLNGESTTNAVVIEDSNGNQSIRWNPESGQSLEAGETLTITYTVQLKDKSPENLKKLYGNDGSTLIPLNNNATLNYAVEGSDKLYTLAFPVPQGNVEVGKLVETIYLDDQPQANPTVQYALVGDNFTWVAPKGSITNSDGKFLYQESKYDGLSIESNVQTKEVGSAGSHTLGHYYNAEIQPPTDDEVIKALGDEAVTIDCVSQRYSHEDVKTGLIEDTFDIDKVTENNGTYQVVVTIKSYEKYADFYNGKPAADSKPHSLVENQQPITITLTYNKEQGKWEAPTGYTPITVKVKCADPADLDAFNKEVVTGAIEGINGDYDYPVNGTVNATEGESITLLYKITVSGDAGAGFTVTDEGARLVEESGSDVTVYQDGDEFTGTIPDGGKIEFYVSKTFAIARDTKQVSNTATVENTGEGKDPKEDEKEVKTPVVVTPVYGITSIDKFYVDTDDKKQAATDAGINLEGYAFPGEDNKVVIPYGGKVTLLYGITVTGEKDEAFTVKDEGATLVSTDSSIKEDDGTFTGTIPDGGSITFYVEKEFEQSNITTDGMLSNTATVTGEDVAPGKGTDKEDVPADGAAQTFTLTYDANGGKFGSEDEPAAVGGLTAGTITLWMKNASDNEVKPEGKAFPTHEKAAPDENSQPVDVVFMGWTTNEDAEDTIYKAGEAYPELITSIPNFNDDTTVYAVWGYDEYGTGSGSGDGTADAEQVVITPADITIYMGGNGYEGTVVDENGDTTIEDEDKDVVSTDSGFPEPGFEIILPAEIANTDSNQWKLNYNDSTNGQEYSWTFQKYGGGEHNIYRIVPANGTDGRAVRMEFYKTVEENGVVVDKVITEDTFKPELNLNQTLEMKVYGQGIEENYVSFSSNENNSFTIAAGTGELTVRGTTQQEEYGAIQDENNAKIEADVPAVTADEGTVYTINGSDVEVSNTDNIALLFDNIIESNDVANANNTALIENKVDDVLNSTSDTREYEVKYLDLVDQSNGNAWVAADKDVTVYWPLPEGTDENTDFKLLHFKGLHREMAAADVSDRIDTCNVEDVTIEDVTDTHIVFKIGSGGFSPFALVWDNGDSNTDGGTTGGGTTPNPPALNTEDHFSYVVGYEDGMVKPENAITRAEVASIFYRLLKDDVRDANTTDVSEFSDVSASDWYGTTVATLSAMDIVRGYEDGTFRPNAPITRAEFAAIATRFFEETGAEYEPGTFDDVTGDEWFANAIADAVELGLIGGYPDGTVRPNNNITRAEACAIVNRTLGRIPHVDHLLPADEMTTWPDKNHSDWFYADMQEATNGHEYEWTTEQGQKVEEWTEILDKDWEDR